MPDITNGVDLFCLHEIFTSHKNASIDNFQQSWNSYPLTSEITKHLFNCLPLVLHRIYQIVMMGTSTVIRQLPSAQEAVKSAIYLLLLLSIFMHKRK